MWRPGRRKEPQDRRGKPRLAVERVTAVYFEGATNCSHPVGNLSVEGALILTATKWFRGTLIKASLRYEKDSEAKVFEGLWCEVVRSTEEGLCVKFRHGSGQEQIAFAKFIERVVHDQFPKI